ncbi:PAS domain S-box protein [Tepidiphilus olei]|uniref:PAS domain S-box protein n=1 Tax=Tepidiphilus olei TaxID=2502184 RepID=UPI00115E87A3|nr:PAS domain S-box protein [Tepidiphilus olei]
MDPPLLTALLAHIPDAVLLTDERGIILEVNDEFCALTGYARDEVIGQTPRLLRSGQMSPSFYRELWTTIRAGKRWRHDILNRHKDGSLYWSDEIIEPVEFGGKRYYLAFQRDVTEHYRTRQALDEAKAWLEGFLRLSPAVFYVLPASDPFVPLFVSGTLEALQGENPERIFSDRRAWLERVHPDDRSALRRAFDPTAWGEDRLSVRYRLRCADGSYRWLRERAILVRDEAGVPSFVVGVLLDLGQEADHYHLLDKLATNLPGALYVFESTPEGRMTFRYVSEGVADLCGVPARVLLADATAYFASIHPQDLPAVKVYYDNVVRTATPWHQRYRHLLPDGRIVWIEGRSVPERQADGSLWWYGFLADVTERVETEQRMQRQEALQRTILNNLQEIFFVVSVEADGFRFRKGNVRFCELFGIAPESFTDRLPRDIFPVGIAERIEERLQRCVQERQTLRFENTVPTIKGQRRFAVSLAPLFDEHGQVTHLVGLAMDVTDYHTLVRQSAENERLAEERAQTLDSLLRAVGEGIFGIDAAGRIAFWNPAAERILGYRADEVIGLDAHLTFHAQRPDGTPYPRHECPVLRALRERRSFFLIEEHFRHRDGHWIPVLLTATPVDAEGSVAVFSDVTTIKQMQETLRRQAETDPLTGLANRRAFFEALRRYEIAVRQGDCASILMLDLDHFKRINDHYGHAVGDEVLRRFADVLRDTVRGGDMPARIGGEEFAVLLPHTGFEGALTLAERIRSAVAQRCSLPEHPELQVTVSVGVSELSAQDAAADRALVRADAALYEAKARGRDRVVVREGALGAGDA